MEFEVEYGQKTYGTGLDVPKYQVNVERATSYKSIREAQDIQLTFKFGKAVVGRGLGYDNFSRVKSGRIKMTKEEALNLAQGIISFLYLEDEYDKFVIECNDGKHHKKK